MRAAASTARRPAPASYLVAHPEEHLQLLWGIAAVSAITAAGNRYPVAPFPGTDCRGGDLEQPTGILNRQHDLGDWLDTWASRFTGHGHPQEP